MNEWMNEWINNVFEKEHVLYINFIKPNQTITVMLHSISLTKF